MDDINDVGWEQMVQDPTKGENYLELFVTNHPNLVPELNEWMNEWINIYFLESYKANRMYKQQM